MTSYFIDASQEISKRQTSLYTVQIAKPPRSLGEARAEYVAPLWQWPTQPFVWENEDAEQLAIRKVVQETATASNYQPVRARLWGEWLDNRGNKSLAGMTITGCIGVGKTWLFLQLKEWAPDQLPQENLHFEDEDWTRLAIPNSDGKLTGIVPAIYSGLMSPHATQLMLAILHMSRGFDNPTTALDAVGCFDIRTRSLLDIVMIFGTPLGRTAMQLLANDPAWNLLGFVANELVYQVGKLHAGAIILEIDERDEEQINTIVWRVGQRNRPGEETISREYLARVAAAYRALLKFYETGPTICWRYLDCLTPLFVFVGKGIPPVNQEIKEQVEPYKDFLLFIVDIQTAPEPEKTLANFLHYLERQPVDITHFKGWPWVIREQTQIHQLMHQWTCFRWNDSTPSPLY